MKHFIRSAIKPGGSGQVVLCGPPENTLIWIQDPMNSLTNLYSYSNSFREPGF